MWSSYYMALIHPKSVLYLALATYFATGNKTNCYMCVHFARAICRTIHVIPEEVSYVFEIM